MMITITMMVNGYRDEGLDSLFQDSQYSSVHWEKETYIQRAEIVFVTCDGKFAEI